MKMRVVAFTAVFAFVAGVAPLAAGQEVDITSGTASVSGTPLDGTRSIVVPATHAAIVLSGPRTDMTGAFQVNVVELNRSGSSPLRVKVSRGAITCTAGTAATGALTRQGQLGDVNYATGQLAPLGTQSSASYTGVNETLSIDVERDVLVIAGETSGTSYTTNAAIPGHVGRGIFHLALPTGAASCTTTVTYNLLYA